MGAGAVWSQIDNRHAQRTYIVQRQAIRAGAGWGISLTPDRHVGDEGAGVAAWIEAQVAHVREIGIVFLDRQIKLGMRLGKVSYGTVQRASLSRHVGIVWRGVVQHDGRP